MKTKRYTSLLGLSLQGGYLEAALIKRVGERAVVQRTLAASLSLDPVTNAPDLAGREIRNCLEAAGIRERRCVVCVPLKWALTLRIDIPEAAGGDLGDFLNLQAERQLPFPPEDLCISVSLSTTSQGQREALLTAILRRHLDAVTQALRLAGLKPVALTLEMAGLVSQAPWDGATVVALLAGRHCVDLAVCLGRHPVALRSLDDAVAAGSERLDVEALARETRITLGHLPAGVQSQAKAVHLFAERDTAPALQAALATCLESASLSLTVHPAPVVETAEAAPVSPGLLAATTTRLLGRPSEFDFLPPRVSRLRQILGRGSSRLFFWLAAGAVALVLMVAGAFAHQYWRLTQLEAKWRRMAPTATELEDLQARIRRFRPWFDDVSPSLEILRRLALAFPDEGTVWVRSLEIEADPAGGALVVRCSGRARSERDWLGMQDRLREIAGVSDLRFQQVRGQSPLQFTVTFRWNGGESHGA